MGLVAFADEYGTNENKANAFGKCVSREAHERDGVTVDEEETPEAVEDSDDGDSEDVEALAALQALFKSLKQFL